MEAIQFIDCNFALSIDDGNSYVGDTILQDEVDDGVGKQAISLANGGFPRCKIKNLATYDYEGTNYLNPDSSPYYLGDVSDQYRFTRSEVVFNKDQQEFLDRAEYFFGFPVDVIDGVNNASITNGVVAQRTSVGDLMLDRLSRSFGYNALFNHSFNNSVGLDNATTTPHHACNACVFAFIDPVTGESVANPSSRWTQMQSAINAGYESDTRDCYGFIVEFTCMVSRNGTLSTAQHPLIYLREGLYLDDGTFLVLRNDVLRKSYGVSDNGRIRETFANSELGALINGDTVSYRFESEYDDGNNHYPMIQTWGSQLSSEFKSPVSDHELFAGFFVSRGQYSGDFPNEFYQKTGIYTKQ